LRGIENPFPGVKAPTGFSNIANLSGIQSYPR
jgi:hypothetical protein